jgi:hypothetical protein
LSMDKLREDILVLLQQAAAAVICNANRTES